MAIPFSWNPPQKLGERRVWSSGVAFALAIGLLAWLPVLLHDLGGGPGNQVDLTIPAMARGAGLLAAVWLVLVAVVVGLAVVLGRGAGVPALPAAVALGGSALAMLLRRSVQKPLAEPVFSTELAALFLVCAATVVAGIALRALCLLFSGPRRPGFVFAMSLLGVWALVATLYWELGADLGWRAAGVIGVPGLAATLLVVWGRWTDTRGRWLVLLVGGVMAACFGGVFWGRGLAVGRPGPLGRSIGNAPNVIVFMIDSLRADHTGIGGYEIDTTPVLDAAVGGHATVFSRAVATAPFTKPSIAALLTSRLPDPMSLSPEPDAWTMAEAFRQAGYQTAAFSSNHVIAAAGFDRGFGTFFTNSIFKYLQSSFLVGALLAGDRSTDAFRITDRLGAYKIPGHQLTSAALSWMDGLKRPFFAYLHLIDPHWPYRDRGEGLVPPELATLERPITLAELLKIQKRDAEKKKLMQSPRVRELRARYDDEIRYADRALDQLLEALRDRGLKRRTLVVVLSDHGEEFFERGGLGHGKDIEEFMIHVPLVFLWPEDPRFADMPRRVERPVSLLDVLPTLSDYLGLAHPAGAVAGRSLRPLLEGEEDARTGPVVAESLKGDVIAGTYREGSIKVRVVFPDRARHIERGRVELFDLDRDPEELQPFEPAPSHRPLVDRARRILDELWRQRHLPLATEEETPAQTVQEGAEDEVTERLRALGYLD